MLQPLNLLKFKEVYREFLRKTAAYHQGGPDALYLADASRGESTRIEATFEPSFAKLQQLVGTLDVAGLRAGYHAKKERAKARLRRALDAKVARIGSYLDGARGENEAQRGSQPSTSGPSTSASSQELVAPLYGEDGLLRRTVLYLLGHASRAYMTGLNTTNVDGMERMAAALQRPAGQALITVSNHVAALDDPLVVATLLPEGALERPGSVRWTLCATDRCFRYAALVPFFRAAKVLPVARGGGLAQPGMAAAEARLAAGDWVHIFPEGTRSPDGVSLGPVRKGVGRLVASVPGDALPPLVVPFVHRGMENVMPRGAVLPATGQKVDVLVGEPIPVADLLAAARAESWSDDRLHTALSSRVAHGLRSLAQRLDAQRSGCAPDAPPDTSASAPAPPSASSEVSSLDQFDAADLQLAERVREARRRRGGAVSAAWEQLKFRNALQHKSWATQGVAAADGAAGSSGQGGASQARMGGSGSGGGAAAELCGRGGWPGMEAEVSSPAVRWLVRAMTQARGGVGAEHMPLPRGALAAQSHNRSSQEPTMSLV